MDNYSDINLKGGSKIKVGDSLTISDSGILGSDDKPMYLEIEYGEYGQAITVDSKICFTCIDVIGNAEFSNSVSFIHVPKIRSSLTPTEDSELTTKKYVDDKVGSGSSGCLPTDPSFSSIKVGGTPGCEPIVITNDGSITVMESNQAVFVDASNGGASYKLPQKQCASTPYTLATLEDLNTSTCSSSGCIYILCTSDKNLCESIAGEIYAEGNRLTFNGRDCYDITISAVDGIRFVTYSSVSSGCSYISTPKNAYGSSESQPNIFVTSQYNSGCGLHLRVLTQSEYDQMYSHDMTTIYFISGC